jgi:hypothetical protein
MPTFLCHGKKKIYSSFVYQIDITPSKNGSDVTIYTIERSSLLAAKSNDGYALKIAIRKISSSSKKEFKKENESDYYIFAIGTILIIGIFIFIVGYFGLKTNKHRVKRKTINTSLQEEEELSISFEKPLDEQNKIALIFFKKMYYLVIVGSTNILLGKYTKEEIESKGGIEKILESSQEDIENFLNKSNDYKKFEEYKEKASK